MLLRFNMCMQECSPMRRAEYQPPQPAAPGHPQGGALL